MRPIHRWKKRLSPQWRQGFQENLRKRQQTTRHRLKNLHAKIRQQSVKLDFLERASSRLGLGGVKKWSSHPTIIRASRRNAACFQSVDQAFILRSKRQKPPEPETHVFDWCSVSDHAGIIAPARWKPPHLRRESCHAAGLMRLMRGRFIKNPAHPIRIPRIKSIRIFYGIWLWLILIKFGARISPISRLNAVFYIWSQLIKLQNI